MKQQQIDTCWMDAGGAVPPEWTYCGDTDYAGGTILECGYSVQIQAAPEGSLATDYSEWEERPAIISATICGGCGAG